MEKQLAAVTMNIFISIHVIVQSYHKSCLQSKINVKQTEVNEPS